jgi:hypothetical protein
VGTDIDFWKDIDLLNFRRRNTRKLQILGNAKLRIWTSYDIPYPGKGIHFLSNFSCHRIRPNIDCVKQPKCCMCAWVNCVDDAVIHWDILSTMQVYIVKMTNPICQFMLKSRMNSTLFKVS